MPDPTCLCYAYISYPEKLGYGKRHRFGRVSGQITNEASVLDVMRLVGNAINEVCDAREVALDIAEAYNEDISASIAVLNDPDYQDPALSKMSLEKIEALVNIAERIVREFPDTSPEQAKIAIEKGRQEIARLRKICADLDKVLGE